MDLSTFAVSLTPFAADGSLDEDLARALFRRFAAARIGVYVGGSGTGEGLTLSRDETFRLYQLAREELRGRVPVRAMGIEPRTVGEMIALAEIAEEAGLEAMQVYSILAPGATPKELEEYFCDALAGIALPAVISTHHAVGYTIPVEVVARVVERCDRIIGVNTTRADIRLLDLVGKSVAVHVAEVGQIFAHLALGGHGFIGNTANLIPEVCVRLIERFGADDFKGAASEYARLLRVHEFNVKVGTKGTKAALALLGLPAGHIRKPRLPPTEAELESVRNLVRAVQLAAAQN